jgi:hypothetical protein
MTFFAKIENGVVIEVIVADQEFINTYAKEGEKWVETQYTPEPPVPGTVLRKNYAIVGGVYDEVRDAFYLQQPYPSWTLDENTCTWIPPVPLPTEHDNYDWDEATQTWVAIR